MLSISFHLFHKWNGDVIPSQEVLVNTDSEVKLTHISEFVREKRYKNGYMTNMFYCSTFPMRYCMFDQLSSYGPCSVFKHLLWREPCIWSLPLILRTFQTEISIVIKNISGNKLPNTFQFSLALPWQGYVLYLTIHIYQNIFF